MATKNKESKFKKTKSKATPKPRSNNGATAPVAKARSGGSDGYRGYDYQILATVWLALDLMISGKADVIIVTLRFVPVPVLEQLVFYRRRRGVRH